MLLQYLLGFRRLGWKTLFVDHLEPSTCVDEAGRNCALGGSANLRYVLDVVRSFGLEDDYVLTGPGGESLIGMPRSRLLERVRHSAFLLNIMGYLRDEEILGRASKRVFLDIDPGFGQFWDELGLHRPFAGYDAYVTIGLNIGRPDCTIPTCGLDWIVTPPAGRPRMVASLRRARGVVHHDRELARGLWPRGIPGEDRTASACTSSAGSWTCPGSPAAPSSWPSPFIRPRRDDLALLSDKGWSLVDPRTVAGDPLRLSKLHRTLAGRVLRRERLYTSGVAAVGSAIGASATWRAASRYWPRRRASRDTIPTGEGLLTFSTLEDAVAGVEEITRRPGRHARAARALAEEYFDSDKVLGRLLQELGMA